MADHGAAEIGTGGVVEYSDRLQTYQGFLRLLKWSIAGIVVLLAVLAYNFG
jgi:hypothetical protein